MSAWVQLAAALGAGLAAGIMGIALIPFLEKLRLFEPEPKTKDTQHKDGQEDTAPVRRRPTNRLFPRRTASAGTTRTSLMEMEILCLKVR